LPQIYRNRRRPCRLKFTRQIHKPKILVSKKAGLATTAGGSGFATPASRHFSVLLVNFAVKYFF
jgi:hypothetical protein